MSKTIRTSNNLTIDAVGDIILDADNADVKLQDGGTEFGRISRITSDLVIKSMGNNNDIILKGIDDSATINALTLDMSEGGAATFSGNVTATDITANSLTTNVISSNGSNAELSLQASGTGDVLISALRVNGTTLDSSDSTKITIAENVDVTGTLAVTGAITLDGVTITDNTISTNASNADLEISANGTGDVLLGTLRFRRDGANGLANVIESDDSTTITINDALEVTGATDIGGALTGTSASFSTTLAVTGAATFSGTAIVDNITINDSTISSSSNADINISAGGTGDLRVDSHVGLKVQAGDAVADGDHAHIYAKDDTGSAEVYVRDEAGNVTKLSPHNEKGNWEYFSRNVITGKVIRIDMEKMVRKLEELTGERFIENA